MYPAPHGALCARLLPVVMAANIRALQERQPESDALRRYDEIAQLLAEVESMSTEEVAQALSATGAGSN